MRYEHVEHEPYISAVMFALFDRGIEVEYWYADPNDPRDAAISVVFGASALVLGWNEERGWCRGVDVDGDGHLSDMRAAQLGVLPAPTDVAAWCLAALTNTADDPPIDGRRYRDFDDADGLDDQLKAYWPPEVIG